MASSKKLKVDLVREEVKSPETVEASQDLQIAPNSSPVFTHYATAQKVLRGHEADSGDAEARTDLSRAL